jgi:nickel-dependent lactate racemase
MMIKISLPRCAWPKTKELILPLPDTWQVELIKMQGDKQATLTPGEIEERINAPIGTPKLRELAKGRHAVAVLFDDETRPTKVAPIARFILKELNAVGIPDERIRFICGLGLHSPMNRNGLVRKLGEDIVSSSHVFNHNAFGNCTYIGTTNTFHTRVSINEDVMRCDLKILIGLVVPHHLAGFGGGGKLILPGVAAYETVQHNHTMGLQTKLNQGRKSNIGMGMFDDNPLRRDIDEAAKLAGVDFLINILVNSHGETTAVFAGDLIEAHIAAVKQAKKHYLTSMAKGNEIVIANTFSHNNVPTVGLIVSMPAVTDAGGDIVLIVNYPDGPTPHYLSGRWGINAWALTHQRFVVPENIKRLIVLNEYPHKGGDWFEKDEKIQYFSRWEEVVELLENSHRSQSKVAVYPNAEMEYCI